MAQSLKTFTMVALLLAGCGPMAGLGPGDPARAPYETPFLRLNGDDAAAFVAVERYVSSMGWTVDSVDAASERLVAHVDIRDSYTLQRDTWTFQVQGGLLAAHRRISLGDTNGTSFVTSDDVCATYTYAAEDDHLMRIAALIAPPVRSSRVAEHLR